MRQPDDPFATEILYHMDDQFASQNPQHGHNHMIWHMLKTLLDWRNIFGIAIVLSWP